jgi:hypothetical protein
VSSQPNKGRFTTLASFLIVSRKAYILQEKRYVWGYDRFIMSAHLTQLSTRLCVSNEPIVRYNAASYSQRPPIIIPNVKRPIEKLNNESADNIRAVFDPSCWQRHVETSNLIVALHVYVK